MTIKVSIENAESVWRHMWAELQPDQLMFQQFLVALQGSTPISLDYVRSITDTLAARIAHWQNLRATSGLQAYAQLAMGDPAFDFLGNYDNLVAAFAGVMTAIQGILPRDASGALLSGTLNAQGQFVVGTLTPSQMSAVVAPVQAVLAILV